MTNVYDQNVYRKKSLTVTAQKMRTRFEVNTKEGDIFGKAGDYLVIGVEGEMYPMDSNIFEKSYDIEPDKIPRSVSGDLRIG